DGMTGGGAGACGAGSAGAGGGMLVFAVAAPAPLLSAGAGPGPRVSPGAAGGWAGAADGWARAARGRGERPPQGARGGVVRLGGGGCPNAPLGCAASGDAACAPVAAGSLVAPAALAADGAGRAGTVGARAAAGPDDPPPTRPGWTGAWGTADDDAPAGSSR